MSHRNRIQYYKGLYTPEADSGKHGIWVSQDLYLPVIQNGINKLLIEGNIDKKALRLINKKPIDISIHNGADVVARKRIFFAGKFKISANVPLTQTCWKIRCSHGFVPQEIGRGDDRRLLAWRVTQVLLNEKSLIDSSAKQFCMDVPKAASMNKVNLVGFFGTSVGLAEGARAMAKACSAVGVTTQEQDVSFLTRSSATPRPLSSQDADVDIYHVNFDNINPAVDALAERRKGDRYSIGYWAWEQERLPSTALAGFEQLDEVWVPSRFVQDAVLRSSPVPVLRVPHAITAPAQFFKRRQDFGIPDKKIACLVMFDFDSGRYRKNPEAAICAFQKAATLDNRGFLVIKVKNEEFHDSEYKALVQEIGNLENAVILTGEMARSDLWDLMNACDILISLHRAEGFGLCIAEMMALGKVVIATNWSGNTDFMNAQNSCPVRCDLKPLEERYAFGHFQPGELWAEPDPEHATTLLLKLYQEETFRRDLGAKAKKDITAQLAPYVVGAIIQERLNYIALWNS